MSSLSKLKSWAASVWYIFVVADMYWARLSRDPEHVAEDLLELGKLNLDRRRWDAAGMYYGRAQTIARCKSWNRNSVRFGGCEINSSWPVPFAGLGYRMRGSVGSRWRQTCTGSHWRWRLRSGIPLNAVGRSGIWVELPISLETTSRPTRTGSRLCARFGRAKILKGSP
jgi:hypothetical protein